MDGNGIDRLRFLLSGISSATSTAVLHQPSLIQQQFPPPLAFDNNAFQNLHTQRILSIKKLVHEQEKYEGECLREYEKLSDERKKLEANLEALQIIKGSDANAERAKILDSLSKLQQKLKRETHLVQEKMLQFRAYQQDALASAGFPLFKVSNDPRDLTNMLWVLAPYLASL